MPLCRANLSHLWPPTGGRCGCLGPSLKGPIKCDDERTRHPGGGEGSKGREKRQGRQSGTFTKRGKVNWATPNPPQKPPKTSWSTCRRTSECDVPLFDRRVQGVVLNFVPVELLLKLLVRHHPELSQRQRAQRRDPVDDLQAKEPGSHGRQQSSRERTP